MQTLEKRNPWIEKDRTNGDVKWVDTLKATKSPLRRKGRLRDRVWGVAQSKLRSSAGTGHRFMNKTT